MHDLGNFEADPARYHKWAQWPGWRAITERSCQGTNCCSLDPLFPLTVFPRKVALFNFLEAEQHTLHCVSPSASSEK
jgi:hypothetical protein